MYRFLGNSFGQRRRTKDGLPEVYIDRAKWILCLFEKYKIPHDYGKFLELGTGWVQWESAILRLFYNAAFTLYDVWDNRQIQAFKAYISGFRDVFDSEIEISALEKEEALNLLEKILLINSFDQLYNLLGFQYVVDPTGTLCNLEHEAYDVCFSYNVFEHIDKAIIADYIKTLFQLLKPGGYSIVKIELSDHLTQYDRGVNKKNYLKYSDFVWGLFFENKLQYINRIQRGEWLRLFSLAGFELLEEESIFQPIYMRINKKYEKLDHKDIECISLKIVHQKPFTNSMSKSYVQQRTSQ
jgi:SAM-dependent methyltransferase